MGKKLLAVAAFCLLRAPQVPGLYLQQTNQVVMVKGWERSFPGSGRKRGRVTIVQCAESILRYTHFLAREKIKLYQSCIPPAIEGTSLTSSPSSFQVSPKWVKDLRNACGGAHFWAYQAPGRYSSWNSTPSQPKPTAKPTNTTWMPSCTCTGKSPICQLSKELQKYRCLLHAHLRGQQGPDGPGTL